VCVHATLTMHVYTSQGGGILREGEDLEAGDEAVLLADGLAAAMQALPLPAAYYRLPLTKYESL